MLLDILLATLWGLPCWLWLLLASIIPFILGWLFGSSFRGGDKESSKSYGSKFTENPQYREMQDRINAFEKTDAELKYKIEQLEADLKKCRSKRQTLEMETLMYKAKLEELGQLPGQGGDADASAKLETGGIIAAGTFDPKTANRTGYGGFFSKDNLQVVEGIGPKVESILKGEGINVWSDLAAKTPEELRAILKANKLHMMNPDSWPQQAKLADEGKWDELYQYQIFLDGGRQDQGDFETPAKIDRLAMDGGLVVGTKNVEAEDTGINYAGLFESDNLQIVEGIGPKTEKILKDNGINNWADLAAKTPDELKAILAANKLQMINPESWSRQAQLAADGQWSELIEYQKFLDGGRENTGDFENDSKVEKLAMKLLGFSNNPEDLKIIEGIGPKIEGLMKDAGINTWADLAAASVDKLKEILEAAGDRYKLAKPDTWPRQASLAADGKWGELQEYQDYLDKGVDPGK